MLVFKRYEKQNFPTKISRGEQGWNRQEEEDLLSSFLIVGMVSRRKNSRALNLEETKESYNKYHDCIYKEKKPFNATVVNTCRYFFSRVPW